MFLSEYPSPSLFRKHSLGTFLSLLLLAACSPDNDALPGGDGGNTPSAALRIEVSASDFTSATTRATDNGAATTFESGDRIGIIVLDGSGNVLSDNIPYKYNGGAWSFDNGNGEGKTAVYYDNKAATYFAYFPYSKEADGIADTDILAALKAKFPPRYDQRTDNAYRASDLLVWSSQAGDTPSKKLEIKFTHAYSSLSLSPSITCKIDGVETSYIPSSVADVSFTIGTEPLLPYRADDGSYRIIVPPQTTSARWLCAYSGNMHSGTMPETALAANNRYTLAPVLKDMGAYTLQIGDFYCKSSDGSTGYLIPGDASLSSEQQAACIGIVLKAGRDGDGNWKDDCDYKLKGTTNPMTDIHGYVLGLYDAKDERGSIVAPRWGPNDLKVEHADMNREQNTGFYGYKNTNAIKAFAGKNGKTLKTDFPATYYATEAYEDSYPAPANSSGWFLPSAGQGKYWLNNRDVILASVRKATGNSGYDWRSYWYWSSSEDGSSPENRAWYVRFDYGSVDLGSKNRGQRVRCVFAF